MICDATGKLRAHASHAHCFWLSGCHRAFSPGLGPSPSPYTWTPTKTW